jgi:SAM-dependent methyltransferase
VAELEWMRTTFAGGYESGDVLSERPDPVRVREEALIGGSYRECFLKAVLPFLRPDSRVLELGPGRGSWTRALLAHVPQGEVHTVDLLDVSEWLDPREFGGRLTLHQVADLDLSEVPDGYFDLFFSFGVLCHHGTEQIGRILASARRKTIPGGVAVHQYGEWNKLYASGRIVAHPDLPTRESDDDSWWPFNTRDAMRATAEAAGWRVLWDDLDLFARDGVCVLKAW